MSMQRRCNYFKATNSKWYVTLGDFEYAEEDHECTTFGPFDSEDAADAYVHSNHSNPGGSNTDDSGTKAPPSDAVAVSSSSRRY